MPYTEFKVGYYEPNDTKGGFLFGLHLGRMIDESVSWGVEVDYFQKTYQDVIRIPDPFGLNNGEEVLVNLQFVNRILPIFAKLNYERAIGNNSPVYFRASGGVGWEFVWSRIENFEAEVKDTRFYNGFGWQLSAGAGYEISSKAILFFDGFYNHSKVKRNSDSNDQGLPSWQELDISGFGVKVGVSIIGFGW